MSIFIFFFSKFTFFLKKTKDSWMLGGLAMNLLLIIQTVIFFFPMSEYLLM